MALATKCPQCGALFRVVADQLKLRGGLVRCGQCRAVFDAIGSLTYLDDTALAQTRTVSALTRPLSETTLAQVSAEKSRQALGPTTTLRISPSAPATLSTSLGARTAAADPRAVRQRTTTPAAPTEPNLAEAGVPTLLAPHVRPATPADDGIEEVELAPPPDNVVGDTVVEPDIVLEPDFIRGGKRPRRGFSIVFGGGSLLLALLVSVQLAVIFRAELLVRWPQLRPTMVGLCGVFGCAVHWPTRPDQLAVIGSELQAIPGTDVLELTAVVRNRASYRQSLPALEVTLTDAQNRAVARKVFTPADYLAASGEPSARIEEGLAAGADYTIRLFFEARGVRPAGFLVYPFYI
jgi:predicted Zn finger-like uncharacterized protein